MIPCNALTGHYPLAPAMPQFTLKRALASTALIAAGCLGISSIFRPFGPSLSFEAIYGFLLWTSLLWICGGTGYLFHCAWAGLAVGMILQIAMLMMTSC